MTEHRTIKDIAEDMRKVALASAADPEKAHSEADDLLCEALLSIAVHMERFPIRDLIVAYKHVEKMYA